MDQSKNAKFIYHTTSRSGSIPTGRKNTATFDNDTFKKDNSVSTGGPRAPPKAKKTDSARVLDRKIFEMKSLSEYNDGGLFN